MTDSNSNNSKLAITMVADNEDTPMLSQPNSNEADADDSGLDARLLAASDLTFMSVDDSFLANLSTSAATLHSDEAEWRQITAWLEDLYATEQDAILPFIAHTPHNLRTLYALMHLNVTRDSAARTFIDNTTRHNAEYSLEANRINQTLEAAAGLKLDQLPRNINRRIMSLSRLAHCLKLQRLTRGSVTAAIHDLTTDEFTQQLREIQLNDKMNHIRAQRRQLAAQLSTIKTQSATATTSHEEARQRILEWRQNITVLSQKADEYDTKTTQHMAHYEATGVVKEQLRIEDILELEKTVEQMRLTHQKVARQVNAFHSLPPDLNLARLKLEETREQLRKLQQQRDEALTGIVDSLQ
ncbi:hypothetical protein BDF19DRAFT_428422 [Syncephalis fuscata]|nr:hypothetical protein BDF19DRAFT_428422 [Syncephalis fuscata]